VHWKYTALQLSWVWEEELGSQLTSMKEQVLAWKAADTEVNFIDYSGGSPSRATASESGKCFIDSLRAALWHLGQPDLVIMVMWDTRPDGIAYGASREDMTQFFKLFHRQSIPIDCDIIQKNRMTSSYAKIGCVEEAVRALGPGTYLASGRAVWGTASQSWWRVVTRTLTSWTVTTQTRSRRLSTVCSRTSCGSTAPSG
jgi:hypothetical protein